MNFAEGTEQNKEQEIEGLLSEVSRTNRHAILSVPPFTIQIGYSTEEERRYIDGVYAQFQINDTAETDTSAMLIESISDISGEIRSRLLEIIATQSSEETTIHIGNLTIYNSRHGYTTIEKVDPVTRKRTFYNISTSPELGLSSLSRRILLSEYQKAGYTILNFHGNLILDTETGDVIALVTGGESGQGTKGKTTITLAAVMQNSKRFAFISNDDITVGINTDGSIVYLPLPAEIAVRSGTMEGLIADGYSVPTERFIYHERDEDVYLVLPSTLDKLGFLISDSRALPTKWVFMDIEPDIKEYTLERLPDGAVRDGLISSIRHRRMIQIDTPEVYGEQIHGGSYDTSRISSYSDLVHQQLLFLGAQFYQLRGGVNRTALYHLLENI